MSVTLADRCDDIIDQMLTRSHGLVLRAPSDSTSGEYDSWRQGLSRRDVRRLVGAGLIARDGEAADVLADCVDGFTGNGDELVAWWCAEGLRGLDLRAARRARTEVIERPEADYVDELAAETAPVAADRFLPELIACEAVPAWFHAWCDRTVHGPKLDALIALGAQRWCGAPTLEPVGAAWFAKLVTKFDRRCAQ